MAPICTTGFLSRKVPEFDGRIGSGGGGVVVVGAGIVVVVVVVVDVGVTLAEATLVSPSLRATHTAAFPTSRQMLTSSAANGQRSRRRITTASLPRPCPRPPGSIRGRR